jgi:hypothetical protein
MTLLSSLTAIVALGLTILFLPIIGGALFAMVFFGLFLLAIVGVLSGVEDHSVQQKDVPIDPTGWRNGGPRGET